MLRKLLCPLVLVLLFQACAQADPQSKAVPEPAVATATTTEAPPELKLGTKLAKFVNETLVTDVKGKIVNLKTILNGNKATIAAVKPGCIYCESFLAVMNSKKFNPKTKLVIVTDKRHGTLKDLQDKAKKYSNIKATWIFDHSDSFGIKLGVDSFPRFLVLDKAYNLEDYAIGLKLPSEAQQAELKSKPFTEVLQKLAETTVQWVISL